MVGARWCCPRPGVASSRSPASAFSRPLPPSSLPPSLRAGSALASASRSLPSAPAPARRPLWRTVRAAARRKSATTMTVSGGRRGGVRVVVGGCVCVGKLLGGPAPGPRHYGRPFPRLCGGLGRGSPLPPSALCALAPPRGWAPGGRRVRGEGGVLWWWARSRGAAWPAAERLLGPAGSAVSIVTHPPKKKKKN